MMTLSPTEREVLAVAQLDAEAPPGAIAKQLGVKEHTVRYTLAKLEEAGVIRRLVYLDLYQLGFLELMVMLRLAHNTPAEEEKLLAAVELSERVTWISRVGGSYSIGVAFLVRSIAETVLFIDEMIQRSGVRLADRALLILASRSYFGVKHLAPSPKSALEIHMGSLGLNVTELQEIDHHILRGLVDGRKATASDMARRLGKPVSTIQYRLQGLRERGVVLRTVYLVDPNSYGMSAFRLRAVTNSPGSKLREAAREWASRHPNVLSFLHCIGPWDFEFRVEVPEPKGALAVAHDLTEHLGSAISSTEIVPTLETKRLVHYPLRTWPFHDGVF